MKDLVTYISCIVIVIHVALRRVKVVVRVDGVLQTAHRTCRAVCADARAPVPSHVVEHYVRKHSKKQYFIQFLLDLFQCYLLYGLL